jgi:hypothetical protein
MCIKIISSLIIVSILTQIVGCYSINYVSVNELREFKGKNDVIIEATCGEIYTLKRDSTSKYYSDWQFVGDSIEWTEARVIFSKDNPNFGKYKTSKTGIAENEIGKIGIEELEVLNTALLSIGVIVGALLVIGYYAFESGFKLKN